MRIPLLNTCAVTLDEFRTEPYICLFCCTFDKIKILFCVAECVYKQWGFFNFRIPSSSTRHCSNPPAVERIQSYDSNTHDDDNDAYVLDDDVNEEDNVC